MLRLKGGDPYVFGRGGEEMLYLQQRGIKVHCIPGTQGWLLYSAIEKVSSYPGPCLHVDFPLSVRRLPNLMPLTCCEGHPAVCCIGITAASGICADIGVPLTHRGLATSVKFLTGHSREGGQEQLDESIDSGGWPHSRFCVHVAAWHMVC